LNNAGITCAADYMYHEELVWTFVHCQVGLERSPMTTLCRDIQCSTITGSLATLTALP
jgi:hypothetical protein